MPLKLKLLELVRGEKIVDAGTASQRVEQTLHVWVQEPKPRRFKMNLAKATADELNIITQNVGGVVLLDVGEMVQQNSHSLYLKSGGDIDVLVKPVKVSQPLAESAATSVKDTSQSAPVASSAVNGLGFGKANQ